MIKVITEYTKAFNKEFYSRIGKDDPTITYQELILYLILYANSSNPELMIDPLEIYNNTVKESGWMDDFWSKLSASKTHSKTFDKPWDQVF